MSQIFAKKDPKLQRKQGHFLEIWEQGLFEVSLGRPVNSRPVNCKQTQISLLRCWAKKQTRHHGLQEQNYWGWENSLWGQQERMLEHLKPQNEC